MLFVKTTATQKASKLTACVVGKIVEVSSACSRPINYELACYGDAKKYQGFSWKSSNVLRTTLNFHSNVAVPHGAFDAVRRDITTLPVVDRSERP